MHDPMVVAFEIRRPWPRRDDYQPADGPRWQFKLRHEHHTDGPDPCRCPRNRRGRQVNPVRVVAADRLHAVRHASREAILLPGADHGMARGAGRP
jgi:hypothetical protein